MLRHNYCTTVTRAILSLLTFLSACADNVSSADVSAKDTSRSKYATFDSFNELIADTTARFPEAKRVTATQKGGRPAYHGFFFYNCAPSDLLQFDPSGRYMVAMQVSIEGREVLPTDTAYIGIIDLQDRNKWSTIGHTTAWNWQQGCRLEFIPGSGSEIIWDARAADGKSFVSQIYDMKTKKTRTLPKPVYTVSPDGLTALTHDFERMEHGGTNFVGIGDKYAGQWAPAQTGIFSMDIKTGKYQQIISVRDMVPYMFPKGTPSDTVNGRLYIFREGYNHSGKRFIAFVKDVRINANSDTTVRTAGFSMDGQGKNIRYLYEEPSHHYWMNDSMIVDNVREVREDGKKGMRAYYLYADDNSGKSKAMLWQAPNGHDSFHPGGDWILTDTYSTDGDYPLNGYEYLYLYHLPSKKFVPLGKFPFKIGGQFSAEDPGIFRVDLHPRFSPDGNKVSFDATHEGVGRQVYLMDISHIIKHPPVR